MTESEWRHSDDPQSMLRILAGKASYRKTRLFAIAACRPILPLLTTDRTYVNDRIQDTFKKMDADADGIFENQARAYEGWSVYHNDVREIVEKAPAGAIRAAGRAFQALLQGFCWGLMHTERHIGMAGFVDNVLVPVQESALRVVEAVKCAAGKDFNAVRDAQRKSQCRLLRDVFGNLFRPSSVGSAWKSTNVVGLAEVIYDDRAFDRMPVLGDALEDAGCTNAEMLEHCRSGTEHVRGCWVVDRILDKH